MVGFDVKPLQVRPNVLACSSDCKRLLFNLVVPPSGVFQDWRGIRKWQPSPITTLFYKHRPEPARKLIRRDCEVRLEVLEASRQGEVRFDLSKRCIMLLIIVSPGVTVEEIPQRLCVHYHYRQEIYDVNSHS